MRKKIFFTLVLVLTLLFSTQAFASLTFTTNAITGTTASTIDLGSGNTLSLQTTANAPITVGTGLVTLGGSLLAVGTVSALNIYEEPVTLENFALGSTALKRTTTGGQNTAAGIGSFNKLTTGEHSTAFGYYAGNNTTTGYDLAAFGWAALYNNTTGFYNTAFGSGVLLANTTGNNNTGLGNAAIQNSTTGSGNTAIGAAAGVVTGGSPSSSNSLVTGSNNTFIGFQSGLANPTQRSNSTTLGANAYVDASNTIVLGDVNVTDVLAGSTALANVKAGSVQYTTGTQPACDATQKGKTFYVSGGAGVKDTFEVCTKDAADAYAWRVIY